MPKKPQKRAPFRRVSKLFLFQFWKPKGTERQVPRRSSVFNDRGLLFIKSYEYIHDNYIKKVMGAKEPLISMFAAMVYLDILLLTKRGEAFTTIDYARERNYHHHTIRDAVDDLENVNLLHRERSPDGSDHIIIIVPHTPLSLDQLRQQHALLLKRRKRGYIQKKRAKAGRNKRDWMPQAFSWKRLLEAFNGTEWKAENFENIVGDIVHTHITERDYSRRQFIEHVEDACAAHKLSIEDKHLKLAFEIKTYIERIN
jgi:hypothetical protein